MAISAQADYCAILSLKPIQQLQEEMSEFGGLNEERLRPIIEVRVLFPSSTITRTNSLCTFLF
jgi:hypothetical protein